MALEWFNAWSCARSGGSVAEPCSGLHARHCASRDDRGRRGLYREAQGTVALRLPSTGISSISTYESDTNSVLVNIPRLIFSERENIYEEIELLHRIKILRDISGVLLYTSQRVCLHVLTNEGCFLGVRNLPNSNGATVDVCVFKS